MIDPRTILEHQAHRLIEAVLAGSRPEDDHWEVKRQWPAPEKCYRSLAAQANATHGEPIKWLIGLDEKDGSIVDVDESELANWYPQVEKHFEGGIAPRLLYSRRVSHDGHHLYTLQFATDEAPYVTKIPDSDRFEVPWRQGNRTRSAKRAELLEILLPVATVPKYDLLSAALYSAQEGHNRTWRVLTSVYLIARGECTIPRHRASCRLECADTGKSIRTGRIQYFRNTNDRGGFLDIQHEQLAFSGPARVSISCDFTEPYDHTFPKRLVARINLPMIESETPVVIYITFPGPPKSRGDKELIWRAIGSDGELLPMPN